MNAIVSLMILIASIIGNSNTVIDCNAPVNNVTSVTDTASNEMGFDPYAVATPAAGEICAENN